MKPSALSLLFVLLQFIVLAIIGLTGPLVANQFLLLFVEAVGLFLGMWAVWSMRVGYFNIAPEPLNWSKMVSRGPYRIIRHPMYLALLLTTLPLVISYFSYLRAALWIILLVNLLLKMSYEEGLLHKKFPEYASYSGRTSRLLPGLY